ncbi:hypothetical protein B7Y94_03155 [Candidatus Saccharibacteria bacterium 32-49-12]|nr:MAG: hypothetical protein B7Y94_03155 [Candidatus Saccharibacteria bacterium 32-49-12]
MANFAGWRPTRSGIMYVLVALLAAGLVFAGAWYVRERGVRNWKRPPKHLFSPRTTRLLKMTLMMMKQRALTV